MLPKLKQKNGKLFKVDQNVYLINVLEIESTKRRAAAFMIYPLSLSKFMFKVKHKNRV